MIEDFHGICWLLLRDFHVMLERCPKKANILGVGEWFVPGGKIEPGETADAALDREIREEWGVRLVQWEPLPIIQGTRIPIDDRGMFMMRPYVVEVVGYLPEKTVDESVELRWVPVLEALCSPVVQVRMMVAAGIGYRR